MNEYVLCSNPFLSNEIFLLSSFIYFLCFSSVLRCLIQNIHINSSSQVSFFMFLCTLQHKKRLSSLLYVFFILHHNFVSVIFFKYRQYSIFKRIHKFPDFSFKIIGQKIPKIGTNIGSKNIFLICSKQGDTCSILYICNTLKSGSYHYNKIHNLIKNNSISTIDIEEKWEKMPAAILNVLNRTAGGAQCCIVATMTCVDTASIYRTSCYN